MRQQKLSISTLLIKNFMETISCHSNQSSYPTRIKKHNLYKGKCPKHVYQVSASSPLWILSRVGWSKPPPVLTSGFNRLKLPWSILPKVVNSGQYSPKWSILVRVVNWKFKVILSVFVVDLYVFFRFLYVHIL